MDNATWCELIPPKAIVGIRPEYLTITEQGTISATVYSALPSGMETTVKVNLGSALLSSVVFGAKDFPVDHPIKCSSEGNAICLFDAESTACVAMGSVEVLR